MADFPYDRDVEAPTELDRVLERLEGELRIARRLTSAGTARWGPADYSKRLVTECQARHLECRDGRLVRPAHRRLDGRDFEIPTPEERDFIEACGLPYEAPEDRR